MYLGMKNVSDLMPITSAGQIPSDWSKVVIWGVQDDTANAMHRLEGGGLYFFNAGKDRENKGCSTLSVQRARSYHDEKLNAVQSWVTDALADGHTVTLATRKQMPSIRETLESHLCGWLRP